MDFQAWRSSSSLSSDPTASDTIYQCLRLLNRALEEESRTLAPHLCLSFAATSQIFVPISKIATTCHNNNVIRETISTFSKLIDSEEEEFLGNDAFAQSLMTFMMRVAGGSEMVLEAGTEAEVVELMYGVASKIRLQPEILPAWFSSRGRSSIAHGKDSLLGERQRFAGVTNKEDFPLFYLLIDYVHHEGRVGDFSRTGLLYIVESASTSEELERWIVESDLATLMASGLGALYSQLSRKLVMSYSKGETPMILAFSDHPGDQPAYGAESSSSIEFQTHMDTFLSYLVFWQDVLEHCKSTEVKQTLLDHFHILFLQQLLYPSLLESSDVDGGSSVAVLTYLRRILESIDHPDLIHLILHYLLALPDLPPRDPTPPPKPKSPGAARRRKSLDLLTRFADVEDKPTPELFNLIDLILTSLKSRSQQTITATLKLVSVILRRHYRYAISTLLRVSPAPVTPQRTIGAHNKELELLFSLVTNIGGEDNIDESYENYLKDNLRFLETHPCSMELLAVKDMVGAPAQSTLGAVLGGVPRELYPHTLRPEDPLLKTLVGLFETFFLNNVETNLSLTGAIVDLTACGSMRLEGWLFVNPAKYKYYDDDDNNDDSDEDELEVNIRTGLLGGASDPLANMEREQIRALNLARREPSWSHESTPPLLAVFQSLVSRINAFRAEIPHFDAYIVERKRVFQVSDELSEVTSTPLPIPQQQQFGSSSQQQSSMKSQTLESISQRMFSPSSRSSSPGSGQYGSHGYSTPTRPGRLQAQHQQHQQRGFAGSRSSSGRTYSPSPLRGLSPTPLRPPSFLVSEADALKRKVGLLSRSGIKRPSFVNVEDHRPESSYASSTQSGVEGEGELDEGVTVSHLLTNVIILQEFMLELAALVQVRASLFGDVRFC
ncbi:hypothetical protein FGG08_000996 [Glutinoglossum americanum]|uniref:Retinoic acid induced 16-like protein-domain-containing protein n=1 Tax=Glutinoglossum americanum TaxID=1670608 RepID=A0A9P8L390_9PEZI|nr:hypothetical protein FGG08_000996 [Glutinoglossum americanum]